jgi:hypothetical protein
VRIGSHIESKRSAAPREAAGLALILRPFFSDKYAAAHFRRHRRLVGSPRVSAPLSH